MPAGCACLVNHKYGRDGAATGKFLVLEFSFFRHRRQAGLQGGGCNLRPVAKRIGGRKSFIGFGALTGASYLSPPPPPFSCCQMPMPDMPWLKGKNRAGWGGILTLCVCCSSSPIAREEFGVVGPFFPPFLVQGHSHKTQQQRRKHLFCCGEADSSRHGKCCSSSSCCCCGDHFDSASLMYSQKGWEKRNLFSLL